MSLPTTGATRKSRWHQNPFSSVLIGVAISTLMFLLLQPALTEAARSSAAQALLFASDPLFISSHLYELLLTEIELEEFSDTGGAIEPLGDRLLLVTPRGRIALIHADGQVDYLPQKVPLNEFAFGGPITWHGFRVADILLHEQAPGEYILFVSHHYFAGDCVEFRISSVLLSLNQEGAAISGDWKTEFAANPCIKNSLFGVWGGEVLHVGGGIQAGGRMLMDGAEHLLVAIGDHGWYEWHDRQETGSAENLLGVDPDSHLGKLVRIELTSGEAEVVASGLRNPQGLVRDSEGNIWETEHGPQGGDELNLLKPSLDYGWPYVTYGIQYGNKTWSYNKIQGRHYGFEEPVYAWIPSIAISNLIVSDGQQFPLWQDDLLIASLAARSLFRVRLYEGRVTYFEKIVIGERFRDITQMPDGRIALLAESAKIIFLQRAPLYCQDNNDAGLIFSHDAAEVCADISQVIAKSDDAIIRSLQVAQFGDPVMRSLHNVYVYDEWLIYVRGSCSQDDLSHRFYLHITPVDANDLAEELTQHGFNVYDFYADEENIGKAVHENVCIVAFPLPDYEIQHIYTGQVIREERPSGEVSWRGPVWEGSYTFSDPYTASTPETKDSPYAQTGADDTSSGAALFSAHCASCHNLAAEHYIGPHLNGVIGRRAGRVAGFNGSAALTSLDMVWTRENLAEFIASPSQFAPGTSMADAGVTEEEAQIIAEFLASK